MVVENGLMEGGFDGWRMVNEMRNEKRGERRAGREWRMEDGGCLACSPCGYVYVRKHHHYYLH
jgi:hypothetical protein